MTARSALLLAGLLGLSAPSHGHADELMLDDENPISSVSLPASAERTFYNEFTLRASDRYQQDLNTLIPLSLASGGNELLFATLNFNYRDGGNSTFSAGLGKRFYSAGMEAVLGFHLHGDITQTEADNQIGQLGLGFDFFTKGNIDLAGNLYLPETTGEAATSFGQFGGLFATGYSIFQNWNTFSVLERGRRGGDLKVKFDVPVLSDVIPTRGHLGLYHFNGEYNDDLTGATAGLLLQPFQGAVFGAEYYGDEEFFGENWVFVAAVSTPLEFDNIFSPREWGRQIGRAFEQGTPETSLRSHLFDSVDRRNWVLEEQSAPKITSQTPTLVADNVVFVNNGGAKDVPIGGRRGRGTFENPTITVQRGVNIAGARFRNKGNVLIAGGRDYNEEIFDAGTGVSIWGGGQGFPGLQGRNFRYGSRPTIEGGIFVSNVENFLLANTNVNTGLASLANDDTLFVENVRRVDILGNTFRNAGQDGIDIEMTSDATGLARIIGNRVFNPGDNALDFDLFGNSRTRIRVLNNELFAQSGNQPIEMDVLGNASVVGQITSNRLERARNSGAEVGLDIFPEDNSFVSLRILNNTIIVPDSNDVVDINLEDNSVGRFLFAGNRFIGNSSDPDSTEIDIDSDDNSTLGIRFANNSLSGTEINFDEEGASTFILENTIGTNTISDGASLDDIDPDIFPLVRSGFLGFQTP